MLNNNCVSYLEYLIPKLDSEIKLSIQSGSRPNPVTRQLWMEC